MKCIHRILSNLIGRFELTMYNIIYMHKILFYVLRISSLFTVGGSCCVWFQTVASCICVVLNLPKCVKEYIFFGLS